MAETAWQKQSASLVQVQIQGKGLEKEVCSVLGWNGGSVVYDKTHGYKVQVDAAYPNLVEPEYIVSVTYTNPDMRGHSNENKLQLKVGELVLLKGAYPDLRVILVIGGTAEAWLKYVLNAFKAFFDEVLFLWNESDRKRLAQIGINPSSVDLMHHDFWHDVHRERISRPLAPQNTPPPCSNIRFSVIDALKNQKPTVYNPNLITNQIARLCMLRSFDLDGAEWKSYLRGAWHSIEMSRNYFNPLEAVVEITLTEAGFDYQGGVARDIPVRSLLHDLGMKETRMSEDFVLFSERFNQPVYIQCKASGGGRDQHGKNIQNRTKEQTARSIFYTASSPDGTKLIWNSKAFHWISVLDGDWGVTRSEPLKYVHMLQMAGYDRIFAASELVRDNLDVRKQDNPLALYLGQELKCRRVQNR